MLRLAPDINERGYPALETGEDLYNPGDPLARDVPEETAFK